MAIHLKAPGSSQCIIAGLVAVAAMWFILLAALLWGCTNPLLKRFTAGFEQDKQKKEPASGPAWLEDVKFLLRRPKYLIAQGVNLLGSVAFFYGLRTVDVSLGSVVGNALTLAITCLVSIFVMGEGAMSPRALAGIVLVFAGSSICTYAKQIA